MRFALDSFSVRPAPFADESASGYLRRVAIRNGYGNAADLLLASGMRPTGRVSWSEASTSEKVVIVLPPRDRNALNREDAHVLFQHARCCPQCLAESGYWREAWELALVPFCSEHKALLLSECLSCKKTLQKSAVLHSHCECGASLCTPTASPIIDDGTIALGRVLLRDPRRDELAALYAFPPELLTLSNLDLRQLVVFLGAYRQFKTLSKPRKLPLKAKPEVSLAVISGAYTVLAQWPAGLQALFQPQNNRNAVTRSLGRRLGYLYTGIHRDFAQPQFAFLRKAFDRLLVEQWPDLIDRKNRWLDAEVRQNPQYIAATILAKKTGTTTTQLKCWVQSGKVAGTVRTLPSGRTQVAIKIGQENIIQQLNHRLNLEEAAAYIGLPENRLRSLLMHDVIDAKQPAAGAQWSIHYSELERFISLFKNTASKHPVSDTYLSLDQIFRYRWIEDWDFIAFMLALQTGAIATAWATSTKKRSCAHLLVLVKSFNKWVESFNVGLSVPDVCSQLGIKQQVGYHLVNQNLLIVRDAGRLGRRIDVEELQRFRNRYCFARDLAKANNRSSRGVIRLLCDAGVNPVSGPDVDGGRQVIYLKADVANVGLVLADSVGSII